MKSLRHGRPSWRFSKFRGLSASVSFLPLPFSPLFSRSNSLLLNLTETLATQARMKCSNKSHSLPHRLVEWIGCHGNHESKLPHLTEALTVLWLTALRRIKEVLQGIETGSSKEELGRLAGYCDLQPWRGVRTVL